MLPITQTYTLITTTETEIEKKSLDITLLYLQTEVFTDQDKQFILKVFL